MNMDLKSEKNVTRSDIARAAGVSVGTVSNVLNNTAVVKEDLRQKVLKTVKELHYVQNYTAKSLASKNNHHIGVAVYEMSNPYHVEVVRGIEEYATQNGYIVSIFMLDNNMDKKLDAVCQRKLSGLVNFMTNEYPATFLDILRKQGTLLVNFGTEQGIRAYVDYADAIKEYCRTLYTLGHRDIGYLYYGDRPRFLADNRGRAFYEARKELGLTENDDYILFGNNSSENSEVLGYESVKRLMRAHPRGHRPVLHERHGSGGGDARIAGNGAARSRGRFRHRLRRYLACGIFLAVFEQHFARQAGNGKKDRQSHYRQYPRKDDFGRRHLVSGKGRHARFFGKSEKRPIKFNSTVDIKKGTLFYRFT